MSATPAPATSGLGLNGITSPSPRPASRLAPTLARGARGALGRGRVAVCKGGGLLGAAKAVSLRLRSGRGTVAVAGGLAAGRSDGATSAYGIGVTFAGACGATIAGRAGCSATEARITVSGLTSAGLLTSRTASQAGAVGSRTGLGLGGRVAATATPRGGPKGPRTCAAGSFRVTGRGSGSLEAALGRPLFGVGAHRTFTSFKGALQALGRRGTAGTARSAAATAGGTGAAPPSGAR